MKSRLSTEQEKTKMNAAESSPAWTAAELVLLRQNGAPPALSKAERMRITQKRGRRKCEYWNVVHIRGSEQLGNLSVPLAYRICALGHHNAHCVTTNGPRQCGVGA